MSDAPSGTGYRVPCPNCGEPIVPKAETCRHCGKPVTAVAAAPATSGDTTYRIPCPHCGGPVVPKATQCRHCGEDTTRAPSPAVQPQAPLPPPPVVSATPAPRVQVPRAAAIGASLLAVAILAIGGLFVVMALLQRSALVVVDNGGRDGLAVEIDGRDVGSVQAGMTERFKVAGGEHRIVVRGSKGTDVFNQSVTLQAGRIGICNPDASVDYEIVTAQYATSALGATPIPPRSLPRRAWHDLDVDYAFEPFPKEVRLRKGERNATRARVGRVGRTY